jgi:hypothetical protein
VRPAEQEAGTRVAVGTALAGSPSLRSQRAGLPHWAPTMGGWRRTALRARPPEAAGTARQRTSSTEPATSPTRKTSPWSGQGTRPASWRRSAAWRSASCVGTTTSPPPTATTPATLSGRSSYFKLRECDFAVSLAGEVADGNGVIPTDAEVVDHGCDSLLSQQSEFPPKPRQRCSKHQS